jgi:hypothetical protein
MASSAMRAPGFRCLARRVTSRRLGVRWFHANQAHHATIFMFQKVTVVDESADSIGVAGIHAESHAWIGELVSRRKGSFTGTPDHSSIMKWI